MEAEARYTWVGAGVLLLVAALVGGLLWLKNVGREGDFRRFAIHFEQQALDGLEIGADVSLRGIKVGRVEDYALADDKLNRVRVEIRVDRRAPVRTNTVAVVTRNFVTGIASITLITREPAGQPLTDIPKGETYPVIAEGRSDLQEIAGRVNKVGEMASIALNNLNQVLDEDNRQAITQTLHSLRDLSAGLVQRLDALDRTLARVDGATRQFGGAADRVAAAVEHGGERLDRTLGETEATLAEARRTLQEVARATGTLQTQAASTAQRLEDSVMRADDQLGAALAEMRLSVEAATRVIDRLREPRAALLGPSEAQLGPGEKLK